VNGEQTVEEVKALLRPLLETPVTNADQISMYFAGRRMKDDAEFYSEHFVMLPAWFQVLIHTCSVDTLLESIKALSAQKK